MTAMLIALSVIVLLVVVLAGMSIRILREYERAVVFRLGRLIASKGPGLVVLIPGIDRMERVSLRTVTLKIPVQEVITRDNVPAKVTAVTYFRVVDPDRAIVEVEDFLAATSQIAQTTLRSILGKAELDALLSERERLNEDLQKVIDQQTEPWGVKVTTVEIKDVEIPANMQRAIARQAEAERERRAKIINAEAEFQASATLADAAEVISRNPTTLQLRYLQTLHDIGGENNSTVVFPLPLDLVRPFLGDRGEGESETGRGVGPHQASGRITAPQRDTRGNGSQGSVGRKVVVARPNMRRIAQFGSQPRLGLSVRRRQSSAHS